MATGSCESGHARRVSIILTAGMTDTFGFLLGYRSRHFLRRSTKARMDGQPSRTPGMKDAPAAATLLRWLQFARKPAFCLFGLQRVRAFAIHALHGALALAARRQCKDQERPAFGTSRSFGLAHDPKLGLLIHNYLSDRGLKINSNQVPVNFKLSHRGPKQAGTDLDHDLVFACRPGPPRFMHSLTLLSIISTSPLEGILQWLVGLGGIAIRQSGPFISARTAARH